MDFNRRRPRTSNDKLNAPSLFLRAVNATTQQQFYGLLKNLVSAVSKDSSNNVAIVAIAAMFFGFAVMVLRPATPSVVNPPAINVQSNPTTTVTTQQEQNQRIDRGSDTGS
ncbi:hypothetical protein VF14_03045 [Nostoc linckia z18]|jgi:hypothetical protein|uniref:Uncharacterized protein n=2 Tax=Nostoc linckia TaxID=92942 RepID=A0A9Q6ENP9_NOSLI|nr:hypothetical protein [Nostoc linckia]PHK46800.1 hypothetical protein VF13_08930 [Nostoc linckia z16]PHJ73280.1 hypothetical protein VF05_01530 [Nostoc linckia z3]PHJ78627.1 hypothetical protein VF03_00515 [Nostoc linckia z2]PHJ85731.1 hypothetical protein VF06_05835 [Nostoc linckia z4]PHJ92233.1 hypothetical protein VF07_01820 [Nostoc linckia z6]